MGVFDWFKSEVSVIESDLGAFGSAIYASAQYDCKFAFEEAVKVGKYAATTFLAITKDHIEQYWSAVKTQVIAEGKLLLSMISTDGMQATLTYLTNMLKAIDWRSIAVSLTGIGLSTLKVTANAALQMLVADVLVAA